ncbi:hypothetical protein C3L33_19836, partial [Rhododendron williamsianum]
MSAPASYLARRAAQKERVRILYRRALKETLNWAVHRHLFYRDASEMREKFDANKNVESLETIDRLLEDGEAAHNKWRHPDPYIVPWAPGGSKFTRNPPPPPGAFLSYFSLSKCPVKGSEGSYDLPNVPEVSKKENLKIVLFFILEVFEEFSITALISPHDYCHSTTTTTAATTIATSTVAPSFSGSMDMTDKAGFSIHHRVCVVFNDALNILRRSVVLYLFIFETDSLP